MPRKRPRPAARKAAAKKKAQKAQAAERAKDRRRAAGHPPRLEIGAALAALAAGIFKDQSS